MTEEENKAIGIVKEIWQFTDYSTDKIALKVVLDLIEKLQKENEELHKEIERQGNAREIEEEYIEKKFISKDKIREKLEELKNHIEILKSMPEYENRKLEAIINVANLENIVFYLKNQVLEEET